MAEEKPTLAGDPYDPLAYLKEFVEGEVSRNPDKLAQAFLILGQKVQALEVRVRELEGQSGGD